MLITFQYMCLCMCVCMFMHIHTIDVVEQFYRLRRLRNMEN